MRGGRYSPNVIVASSCASSSSGLSSDPVPGLLAVASWGAAVAVRLVRILVWVLVVLLHQRRVVSTVLRARGQTVAVLMGPFVVVVFISRHEGAAFHRRMVRHCVVAVAISLCLFEGVNIEPAVCLTSGISMVRQGCWLRLLQASNNHLSK